MNHQPKPGEQVAFENRGKFEVVRALSTEQVEREAPEFVALVRSQLPQNTPIFWAEVRPIGEVRTRDGLEVKLEMHGKPLHAHVFLFRNQNKVASLERTITGRQELMTELKKGCFYFYGVTMDNCYFWVFLSCSDINVETINKVTKLAGQKGGFEMIPTPQKLAEEALQRFEMLKRTNKPGKIINRDMLH